MADRTVFLYAAVYDEIADAEADYEAVFDLHAAGAIGTFDSAVIRKEADGKVRVTKTEKPTQHGAWTGAAVGAGRDHLSALDHRQRDRRGGGGRPDWASLARHLARRPQGPWRRGRRG
jgi:hypothetical protein